MEKTSRKSAHVKILSSFCSPVAEFNQILLLHFNQYRKTRRTRGADSYLTLPYFCVLVVQVQLAVGRAEGGRVPDISPKIHVLLARKFGIDSVYSQFMYYLRNTHPGELRGPSDGMCKFYVKFSSCV